MIDTITLRLNDGQFKIVDHNKFNPSSYNLFYPPYTRMGSRAYIDCIQNPTRKELLEGNYKPQLTIRKRWANGKPAVFLYIQFSAPKLIFGNNFDELVDDDFDVIVDKLQTKLLEMGVEVSQHILKESICVKVHFGKNIELNNYVIPFMIIKEIKKVNYDLRYDISEKDYRNEGHSIRFRSKNFEVIFYDKKKDLLKAKISESKAIDQDSAIQLSLLDLIQTKRQFEVIRMEVRLNNTNTIKGNLGNDMDKFTFQNIFKEKLSNKVLNDYWKQIYQNYELMNYQIEDKEVFLANFLANNPKARISNALQTYAFLEYINQMGVRRFRKFIESRYSQRTWFTLQSSLKRYNLQKNIHQPMNQLNTQLAVYKPLRLDKNVLG